MTAAVAQVPLPLQNAAAVSVDPEHVCVPHDAVVAAIVHAPAPLQSPVLPHGGLAVHRLSVVVDDTFAQIPTLPVTLQA